MTSFDRFSASRAFCVNKSARHEADVMSSKPVERGKSIVFCVSSLEAFHLGRICSTGKRLESNKTSLPLCRFGRFTTQRSGERYLGTIRSSVQNVIKSSLFWLHSAHM